MLAADGERVRVGSLTALRWRPAATAARPTLLMIHGGFHAAWCWRIWGARLAAHGWPCVAVNLPGRSGSRCGGRPFHTLGIGDYAAEVAGSAACLGPCVVIGHSLGGLVAQVAVAQLGCARGMVLVCTSPVSAAARATMPPVPVGGPVRPPGRREMCRRWYRRPPHPELGHPAELARRLCAESPVALNDRYTARIAAPPSGLPTLVIGAPEDPRHEYGQIDRRTAGYHTNTTLVLLAGFGHALPAEAGGEEVTEVVHDWLTSAVMNRSPLPED
jgi:pimeloyl-ACP methyl ester carboxylesterase